MVKDKNDQETKDAASCIPPDPDARMASLEAHKRVASGPVSTFHAACIRLARRETERSGCIRKKGVPSRRELKRTIRKWLQSTDGGYDDLSPLQDRSSESESDKGYDSGSV